jgi:ribonuclease HIII
VTNSTSRLDAVVLQTQSRLADADFISSDLKPIDYGVQFKVSRSGWNGIFRIYANKKGQIRFDYSQIKDPIYKNALLGIVEGVETVSNSSDMLSNVAENERFVPIIGTDESGKGDYFGPLVAAGVYVDPRTKPLLTQLGVRDSKKITDSSIKELATSIRQICANRFSIIEISPDAYNNLYDSFRKEGKNLNTLLAWAHAKAIEEVLSRVDCDYALSDKFADEKYILSKLQERGKKIHLRQEHKAENNIAVAAASVLARARFLEKLAKLSSEYQTPLPKGASDAVVEQARNLVTSHGSGVLRKVAKLHFKTTNLVLGHANG